MNKSLRLLVTEQCNRSCEGCCNKQWNLNKLPIINSLNNTAINAYKTIMITGGEPLLFEDKLRELLTTMKPLVAPKIVYTAKPSMNLISLIQDKLLQGITLTLHTQNDVTLFVLFDCALSLLHHTDKLSLRLNIFDEVNFSDIQLLCNWKIKDHIEWIEDCPLPKNEEFLRIETLWE